jgi:hypothetical protein
MDGNNFNGLASDWPKVVSCSCRATVPRVGPRHGPTIKPGQPEALLLVFVKPIEIL